MQEEQRDEVPRIRLDSMKDWDRIKSNVTKAMSEIVSRTSAVEDDAIWVHLKRWIDLMFEDAKLNVLVNGREIEEGEGFGEETEPYDEVLDRRIWTLSKEQIAWDRTLAERRSHTPREIERLVHDLLRRQRELERGLSDEYDSVGTKSSPKQSPPHFASAEQALATHSSSMSLAAELKETLPSLLERTERALVVAKEMTRMQQQRVSLG